MPIEVRHDVPAYNVGVAAYGAGVGAYQQKVNQIKDAQAFEQQQMMLQLQAQAMRQYQSQLAQQQMQQAQYEQQMQMAAFEQQNQAEQLWQIQQAKQQQVQFEYTEGQRQKQQQLLESYAALDQQYAAGEIGDWQREQMKRQLDGEFMGIKKMPMSGLNKFPEGTEPGKVFTIATDADSQFYGYPKMIDQNDRPIPLVRDPETGQIEIMRNWKVPEHDIATQKMELQQQNHQNGLEFKEKSLELKEQSLKNQQEMAKINSERQQAASESRIGNTNWDNTHQFENDLHDRATKHWATAKLTDPAASYEASVAEMRKHYTPPGQQPGQEPGMEDSPYGTVVKKNLEVLQQKGLPLIQDQSGEMMVDPAVISMVSEKRWIETFQNTDQKLMQMGYIDQANANRAMAWLARTSDWINDPVLLPVWNELGTVVQMSGVNGIPKPQTPAEAEMIPPGVPFINPKTGQKVMK